jgi:hypothetical protein
VLTVELETITKCCTKRKNNQGIHNTNVLAPQVILRVVPVQIMAATIMNTFALCDEASTNTLIDASFAEQIGADGPELLSLDEQDHKKL